MEYRSIILVLEDISRELAEQEVDQYMQEELQLQLVEANVPNEVKQASRAAFVHSTLHGLAASDFDPQQHHSTASAMHGAAAQLAKKHGLKALYHAHMGKKAEHDANLHAMGSEDEG